MRRLSIGISPCPNDTFAFHGLLTGAVRVPGVELDFTLADVEELNERMLAGELDVAKISAHAALRAADRVVLLTAGSALGFGVGPVLLGAPDRPRRAAERPSPRVLLPGRLTTAALLWELFHGGEGEVRHVRFDAIPPALAAGSAELGVCIHEARFTWQSWGVEWVEDLGRAWERETGAPLPLGSIAARRTLDVGVVRALDAALRASIAHARADADGARATMRRHAQELDDDAIARHVALYVTDATLDLGEVGRAAFARLGELARARGLLPPGAAIEVVAG